VPLEEPVVEDAIGVDEDEVVADALQHGAVHDHGLPETVVLLPDVADRMTQARCPMPCHGRDRFVGAVVREHDLEVGPRLVLEALQDELEDPGSLMDGNHHGKSGRRTHGAPTLCRQPPRSVMIRSRSERMRNRTQMAPQ